MRIAVLTSSYPRYPGDGAAPFIRSFCEHLVKQGHTVSVAAPHDVAVAPQDSHGVELHRFRYVWPERYHILGHARSLEADVRLRPLAVLLLPLYLIGAFLSLWRLTGRQRSQAIHAHWVIPNGLPAAWVARLRGIPFIVSLHGSDVFLASKNRLYGMVAGWVFRRAAGVTACSPELREKAIQFGAPESTLLLPYGIDADQFAPASGQPEASGELRVAMLGRLVYKKGFDTAIAALPAVLAQVPQARLVIGGDGPLKEELAGQAARLGLADKVTLAGQVAWDLVPAFLSQADIFVLPSVRDAAGNIDGLPNTLLEAMSCGAAVLASDISGVQTVITSGENGLLFPSGDVNALAQGLLALACDPALRRRLGAAARQTVIAKFGWPQVARQVSAMLALAAWRRSRTPRLGSIYRTAMLHHLDLDHPTGRVLDVGCHDGYFLSGLPAAQGLNPGASLRVGVDPEPVPGAPGVCLVQADGRFLPFARGTFDQVYAMDVIEHVEDDAAFARSLARVVAPGGRLFLSTPSLHIRMFPAFLTRWISLSWGHEYRLGYTAAHLQELFGKNLKVNIQPWNAPAFRSRYLFIRLLRTVAPGWAGQLFRRAAAYDAQRRRGENGFQTLLGEPAERPSHE